MSEIPPENLPIYLQQYSVVVLREKPKDNCFPVQQNPCLDTDFGCCSDGVTPKTDPEGSNCPRECGSVRYSTVGVIPSNVPKGRVHNINLTGTLEKHDGDYVLYFDFSKVNYKAKNQIFFSRRLSGTLNLCGRVLDASKHISYSQCTANSRLYLTISPKKWDFRILKETLFSINIQLNDPEPVPLPVGTVMPAFFTYLADDRYGKVGLQVGVVSGDDMFPEGQCISPSVIPNAMPAIYDKIPIGTPDTPNINVDYFSTVDGNFYKVPNMVGVCPVTVPNGDPGRANISNQVNDINNLRKLTSMTLNAGTIPAHSHTYDRGQSVQRKEACAFQDRITEKDSVQYEDSTTTGMNPPQTEDSKVLSWLLPFHTFPFLLVYDDSPPNAENTTPVNLDLPQDAIYLSCIPTDNQQDYINKIGNDNWKQVVTDINGKSIYNASYWGQAFFDTSGIKQYGAGKITLTQENLPSHSHTYIEIKRYGYITNYCALSGCSPTNDEVNKISTEPVGKDVEIILNNNDNPYCSITSILVSNKKALTIQLYEGMVVLVDKGKFPEKNLPPSLIEFTGVQKVDDLKAGVCI